MDMAPNRRDQIRMAEDEISAFIEEQKNLQVACLDLDGSPHLSTLWFAILDGRLAFETYTSSQKIVNLRRDPRITVLLEDGVEYNRLRGVMIKGIATLVDDGDGLHRIARAIVARNQPDLDPGLLDAAATQLALKRTGVVVEPERVISWDHTRLG
ncbi:MAG: pyridoxamine 5'-phosphate oxidase family protein [Acidimicrobiales bacterium]|jgi:PPOX class probable F420-dependent enzyme|nr:pyridoxamine 5'-phosphate oxidase family protein [Acidimicrobiales bacterium]MDP7118089.1 pyridoxamine 5'-phosphate oxidase family protein [Acidimicrobiales bacterium]MDP7411928.1 pyridoxamine 5'-phosphate oxidase family protein [Acidimicrobiales bacterium]MEE1521228.1 pyridoxamine 5'-phosphate oxidase family protein [Acidimicrobiales bacterium]MEE1570200.1 pyridoxamine 5'-phosphate oxidase family protein [Acidimicrobiales bacterium]|tara:strand:- start:1889 stop:2353 length:465 start_codon:yes stop_codon:yes gene_type:complete